MKKVLSLMLAICLLLCACGETASEPQSALSSKSESLSMENWPVEETHFTPIEMPEDLGDYEAVRDSLVLPLGIMSDILTQSWENAEEIPADELVKFCIRNNLLGKERTSSGVYIDPNGPAEEVETAIQTYFDVSTEYLRSSNLYQCDDDDAPENYDPQGNYLLSTIDDNDGWNCRVIETSQVTDTVISITVGMTSDTNDEPDEILLRGRLAIFLEDNGFKYEQYSVPIAPDDVPIPEPDLTAPENDYILDVEHFVSRENDEYLKYLISNLDTNVPAYSGIMFGEYSGFDSPAEFDSDTLLNVFMAFAGIYYQDYYNPELEYVVVPRSDINTVLDKYFENYHFDLNETSLAFGYNRTSDLLFFRGLISISGWDISSIHYVTDNGDGTITVISAPYGLENADDPNVLYTTVLRPAGDRCYCLSHHIEYK